MKTCPNCGHSLRERTSDSHRHYFAELERRWQTLPEDIAGEYPSTESLRHKALIRCGYATETDFVLSDERDADVFAAGLAEGDEQAYSIIERHGCVVRRYQAKSQSYNGMGREQFQQSKWRVLNWIDRELLKIEDSGVVQIA